MATLYNPPGGFGTKDVDHLPTEHELDDDQRRDIELQRLTCLLAELTDPTKGGISALADASSAATRAQAAWTSAPADGVLSDADAVQRREALKNALVGLNLQLLSGLACAGDEVELAYQVGRSLRDTTSFPPPSADAANQDNESADTFVAMLGRERITTLQQWLETLAPHFQPETARIVSVSLGRWSEFVGASIDPTRPGDLKASEKPPVLTASEKSPFLRRLRTHLLRQGDVWLQLLTGTQTTKGMLDPEGYVAAGELALRRTTRIILRIVRHYCVVLLVLALALAAVLTLSAVYLGGAAKVWTSIAAIATSLGVTAKGIGSSMSRMARTGEAPIFGLAEEDVLAWSITALPPVRLDRTGIRAIRRAGVAPSRRLGRLPAQQRTTTTRQG
jgi:hypothetical protein